MARRTVSQLAHGDSVDDLFLVSEKQLRVNRQGGFYLHLELRDSTGSVQARLWNATEEQARQFEVGDYLRIKGKTQLFQGSLQVIVTHFALQDPAAIDPEEFLPRPRGNADQLFNRLRQILEGMGNHYLRGLVQCFLFDEGFVRKLRLAPAGIKNHHAYLGGLLEHVVSVLNVADRITDLYPEIDRDLLLTGIFLHDVAKVDELSYERGLGYSDEGQLIGHLVMGVEMLNQKVVECSALLDEPFPPELLLRLKHMIVSHHGSHEFGSPKLPMTLEAVVLHYLDNLDAKIHSYSREIKDDASESSWTPYHQTLGRRLFKGAQAAAKAPVGLES